MSIVHTWHLPQLGTMHYSKKLEPSLWIFGYGSLIWNPGFSFDKSHKAYAMGFARRMYQGNTYHRGDNTLPGRVATLIEHPTSSANGLVFRVDGQHNIRKAVAHLKERELDNGYEFIWVTVHVVLEDGDIANVRALTCIATERNEFYLGPDRVTKMAEEICTAKGLAGPNVDYVLKLAEHVRSLFPKDEDHHLFQLEVHIRSIQSMMLAR